MEGLLRLCTGGLILLTTAICTAATGWAIEPSTPAPGANLPVRHHSLKLTPLWKLSRDQLDHPMMPVLKVAYETVERIGREVQDYSCDLVLRERIKGRLNSHEFIRVKVRREQRQGDRIVSPFSVYMRFRSPSKLKGREVLYVDGQNDDKLLARNGGVGNLQNVTLSITPDSDRAMRGRHYPLTEIGMQNIVFRMIEAGQIAMKADKDRRECKVQIYDGAKIEGRKCQCIQITFPVRRESLQFHVARIFLDDELKYPIRFAAYSWPLEPGKSPRLLEEYTFLNLKVNVGLTDRDFDRLNPEYKFYRPRDETDRQAGLQLGEAGS